MKTSQLLLAALAIVALGAAPVGAQTAHGPAKAAPKAPVKAPTNDDCLGCHGEPSLTRANGKPVNVPPEAFAASVHGQGGVACVDCHADLATTTEFPHANKVAPVRCATCHDKAVADYDTSVHAEARRASAGSVAATCIDCHGTHDIRPKTDPDSRTYHLNLPQTCGRCHGNAEIIKRGRIAIGNVYSKFQDSIHGQALSRAGLMVAPNCSDCHGSHDIKREKNPDSRVYRPTIPSTCGKCHQGVVAKYQIGVHGTMLRKGNPLAAVCTDCHTTHDIKRVDVESWRMQVINECGTCHTDKIKTYRDTFHGQVNSLGFVRVATCADCHGAHDILPQSDPRSSVAPARLVKTCQRCHPNATSSFVRYDPHAQRDNRQRNPTLYYAAHFMDWLLVGVFAFFGLHTALWFSRAMVVKRGQRRPRASRPDRTEK